jgi:hypothetical protein
MFGSHASMIWAERSIEDYANRTAATIPGWRSMNGRQTGDPPKFSAGLVTIAGQDRPPLRSVAGAGAVAGLIAGGNSEQLGWHLPYGITNGLSETELKEVIIHMAFYAGWPKAVSAMNVAKRVFGE